jgi:hypothetical protein
MLYNLCNYNAPSFTSADGNARHYKYTHLYMDSIIYTNTTIYRYANIHTDAYTGIANSNSNPYSESFTEMP